MKKISIIACAAVISVIAASCGPTAVIVRERPVPPVMVRPAPPRAGYIWIEGEWVASGGRYVYRNGYWARPRPGRYWHSGHWENSRGGWYWHRGYWR